MSKMTNMTPHADKPLRHVIACPVCGRLPQFEHTDGEYLGEIPGIGRLFELAGWQWRHIHADVTPQMWLVGAGRTMRSAQMNWQRQVINWLNEKKE